MLRQISNAAINLIGGRAMHPLTALLSDLKVMRSTAELAPNILDKKHLVYLLALRGGSTNYIVMACSRVNCYQFISNAWLCSLPWSPILLYRTPCSLLVLLAVMLCLGLPARGIGHAPLDSLAIYRGSCVGMPDQITRLRVIETVQMQR